ncbi:hypothetical protein NT6N_02670 [Oceaniferula spumae]|uniref:Helix-turn-helix domain-containing protein n=1 Tax=Oceaniferula spumae TaxID=2979115 RepID=A0AAT9FGX3_9BACT
MLNHTKKENPDALDTLKPEFLRISDAVRIFGISRSRLFELLSEKKIPSVSLKRRGAKRGIRLISYGGLKKFLEDQIEEGISSESIPSSYENEKP